MHLSGVRPTVCLPHSHAAAAGLLLWVRPALRYRSIAARRTAACGQCHVASVRRKLNTDALAARRYQLSSSVFVCVCYKPLAVLSKRQDGSSWLFAWKLGSKCTCPV